MRSITLSESERGLPSGPLIGRTGVMLVAIDAAMGGVALPLAALIRYLAGNITIEAELGNASLWICALASVVLWSATLRVVDSGYPSTQLNGKGIAVAAALWTLAASGTLYLLDKELASRLLILIAAALVLCGSLLARQKIRQGAPAARSESLPQLSVSAESALVRGEPVSIDLSRISHALARPTIVFDSGQLWIYPSVLSPSERLIKRGLDLFLAVIILALAAIPMAIIAIAILLFNGSPLIYRDERVGLFGRRFSMHKFRSMRVGAHEEREKLWSKSETTGPAFKIANDPRVTRIGKFLRRFSLDELPQLFDVLRGEMSLVGPRPAGVDELERYEDRHRLRLTVRPGVTGLWQVRRRVDANFEQRMSDDLEYIRRWSVLLDLQIVARSVAVILSGRGV